MKSVIGTVLSIILFSAFQEAPQVWPSKLSECLRQLRSRDGGTRETARMIIANQYKTTAESDPEFLIEVEAVARDFVNAPDNFTKEIARNSIFLLGDLRAVRSIPFLIDHLSFQIKYLSSSRIGTYEYSHPTCGALVDIGQPSLELTLSQAESTSDPDAMMCSALIVKRTLKMSALNFLDERILRSDESTKINLRTVRKNLEMFKRLEGN